MKRFRLAVLLVVPLVTSVFVWRAMRPPPGRPFLMSTQPTEPERWGVVPHAASRGRAHPGYNLFDAHHDTRTYLVDMDGKVVHTWSYLEEQPGGPPPMLERAGSKWMALNLLNDGSLMLVHDQDLIMRLSWDSKLIAWAQLPAHHDLYVDEDGCPYSLLNAYSRFYDRPVLFSEVAKLDPSLAVLQRRSTYDFRDAFPNTTLDAYLAKTTEQTDDLHVVDYYHENSVSVIGANANGATAPWHPGNVLICLRNIDRVLVLDRTTFEPLWSWGAGVLEGPHNPTLLPSGNLLVFDNGTVRHKSRVIEYDPVAERIVWQYPPRAGMSLYTAGGGAAQRLRNGNTLITESDEGRVLEVTPTGEVVWEFLHPYLERGEIHPEDWFRARIYRMTRYDAPEIDRLVKARVGPPPAVPAWWGRPGSARR